MGENHPKVARAIYYLSIAKLANGGSIDESIEFLREGVAMMRKTEPLNVNLPYMLQTLSGRIVSDKRQSRTEQDFIEAESLNQEARSLFILHYGENSLIVSSADGSLAFIRNSGAIWMALRAFGKTG